jgi:hypothetical protein
MNRFWGRNEHGSVPKFSRDDDQILALNYENLCDGDYLNRLFTSDASIANTEDGGSEAHGNGVGSNDPSLFNADLPEDIIIYGNNLKLGHAFCRNRFNRQITSLTKQPEAITNLVNRQAIVFEHIGKIMIERCKQSSNGKTVNKAEKNPIAPIDAVNIDNVAAVALDCCLKLLDGGNCRNLSGASLHPLISLVFHVNQEAAIKLKHPTLTVSSPALSASHISILRNIFAQSALQCHEMSFTEKSRSAMEDSFRTSMAAFYGLLALGLHTRNPSELMVAVTHLMMILLRAEEWYDWFKSESKLQLAAVLASVPATVPAVQVAEKAQPSNQSNQSGATTKLSVKGKAAAEAGKGKASNKISNPVAASSPQVAASPAVSATKESHLQQPQVSAAMQIPAGLSSALPAASTALITVPAGSAVPLPVTDRITSAGAAHRTEQHLSAEEARLETSVVDLVPSSGQLNIYNSHNNSNPNMKIWETGAKSTSKLPAEKERGESMHGSKKPTKNLKAEARVIQEILDPNMFSAQELSAYYANNPSTVNYVMKGNSNQGGEDVLAIKNQAQSNKKAGMHGANKNNNRQGAEDAGLGDSSARYESSANHRAGSGGGGHSSTTAVARHKKSMIEFKDTLQSLLKIPKPVLKVLHESCAATAAGDFEKRPASSVLAVPAGVHKATADTSAAVSTASYVWSCGQNSYGELGLGDAVMRKSFSRVSCLDDKRIVSIGAGNEHSLFVTQDGKLLTAGYNDNGQCGIGTTQQVRHPAVISALEGEDISQVHVYNGCEHTLVVTRDGKIFSFGYNYRGQVRNCGVYCYFTGPMLMLPLLTFTIAWSG